jgi:hypothetical protein
MVVLRLAFLIPALADFILAVLAVYRMVGVTDDSLVPRGQFAAVVFSWGILLFLGMRKPVERAWILQPTAIVIGCIFLAVFVGFIAGVVPLAMLAIALFLCATMIWLCLAGLKNAIDVSLIVESAL